jgi:hypothetical protein
LFAYHRSHTRMAAILVPESAMAIRVPLKLG